MNILKRNNFKQNLVLIQNLQFFKFGTFEHKVISNELQSLEFKEILDPYSDLDYKMRECFGPHSSGICVIEDVPGYREARMKLLQLTNRLGQIPREKLNKLKRPEARNTIGWIHSFDNPDWQAGLSVGRLLCNLPQYQNGHYFNHSPNDLIDFKSFGKIQKDMEGLQTPTVWPEEIPELRQAFLNLSQVLHDTTQLLSHHIDKYLSTILMSYPKDSLSNIIKHGSHSGTFFHYDTPDNHRNEFTGYHNDYTAITAIVPGAYIDQNNKILESYERDGGLHYKTRLGEEHRVHYPQDSIVFTIGEVTQIISGGMLEASPIRVKKPEKYQKDKVSRNSFALRFKPLLDTKLYVPNNIDVSYATKNQNIDVPKLDQRWSNGMNFGQFVLNCLDAHIRPKY